MANWAIKIGAINMAQKGFLPYRGCFEHNFLLQSCLQDARRRKRIGVAWLNLQNTFGSVPTQHVLGTLGCSESASSQGSVPGPRQAIGNCHCCDCSAVGGTEKGEGSETLEDEEVPPLPPPLGFILHSHLKSLHKHHLPCHTKRPHHWRMMEWGSQGRGGEGAINKGEVVACESRRLWRNPWKAV